MFAIKSRSRRENNQRYSFLARNFSGGMTRIFYGSLLARFTSTVDEVWFSSVPECRICWWRLKYLVLFFVICEPKFMKFWDAICDPLRFPIPFSSHLCHFITKTFVVQFAVKLRIYGDRQVLRVGCRAVAVFADATQREFRTWWQCNYQLPSGGSGAASNPVDVAGWWRGQVRRITWRRVRWRRRKSSLCAGPLDACRTLPVCCVQWTGQNQHHHQRGRRRYVMPLPLSSY